MEKIFITEMIYKNIKFKIYMVNGKFEIQTKENVPQEIIEEVRKIIFDKNKIKKEITKKKIVFPALIFSTGLFIGVFSKNDLYKINTISNEISYEIDVESNYELEQGPLIDLVIESEKKPEIINQDELMLNEVDYYSKCMDALCSNKNLTTEERLSFMERYPYIEKNKDYINFEELLNNLRTVRIDRYDYINPNGYDVVGTFTFDENTKTPIISLYAGADNDTLIHEEYHVIKHNKYYWDNLYYYNNHFIGTEEYEQLDEESKKQIIESGSMYKYLYGNMIEEAHTALLTAEDDNSVEKVNIPYYKEVYIYKIYEQIFGKENMEKNMLQSNQVAGFMNNLLNLGCSKSEALAITERLDIYNNTYEISQMSDIEISLLKYQICDDLAYVYNKKFNTINNIMLKMTILSITNNIDCEIIKEHEEIFKSPELYNDFISKKLTIENYFPEDIIDNYAIKNGVEDIAIDYFSKEQPQFYIKNKNNDSFILKSEGENIVYNGVSGNSKTALYSYKLYTDYYEYAMNHYNKDQEFAVYFASVYANNLLNPDQKGEIISYYELWQNKFYCNEEVRKKLLTEDFQTITKIFGEVEEIEDNNLNIH